MAMTSVPKLRRNIPANSISNEDKRLRINRLILSQTCLRTARATAALASRTVGGPLSRASCKPTRRPQSAPSS